MFFLTRQAKDRLRSPINNDRIIHTEIKTGDNPKLRENILNYIRDNTKDRNNNPNAVCLVNEQCAESFLKDTLYKLQKLIKTSAT